MPLVNFEVQTAKLSPTQLLTALSQVIPSQTITNAIVQTSSSQRRQRVLPTHVVVALVIAMSLWSYDSIAGISPLRLSFTGSLRVIRRAIPQFQQNRDTSDNLNLYFSWLVSEILALEIPPPQNRTNPRVVKKTRSKHKSKKRCHRNNQTLRQQLSFLIFPTAS